MAPETQVGAKKIDSNVPARKTDVDKTDSGVRLFLKAHAIKVEK